METGHGCQEQSLGEKSSSSICEIQDDGLHNEDHPAQGKQKKTSFKLFGGRKSLVSLPSFFGGKNKGLGKGNSKKSLIKSKTHDGICDVPEYVEKKGYSDISVSRPHGHETTKTGNTLPNSLSADSGITSPVKLDFNFHDVSPMGSTEGFDKKLGGEKSFSFPRPKKGLKGLFSSIRRHKKSKTDTNKCERYDHITETVILEQLNRYPSEDAELQCSSDQPKMKDLESEVSPDFSPCMTVVCEEEEMQQSSMSMPNLTVHQTEELVTETSEQLSDDQNKDTASKSDCPADCPAPERFPDVNKELLDKDSAPPSAGDHTNLMFEDVSSLKSFDSLTGCGDIIAEQDIDNISDTSLSLERSREATKRGSCLVTYQGGGEEMALPDNMDEYLQQLLEDGNEASATYKLEAEKEHGEQSKGFSKLERCAMLSNTEILTPQSDQQESAPNSDEGYYDSNTPGPDDDAGEGFSHKERLPRDSYSGDALYEFYEPDESLMSPAPGGESLYENKSLCSEIFDQFFDFILPMHDLNEHSVSKKGATETEEERLAAIQKQLLFWERQREVSLKGLEKLNKDAFSKGKKSECEIQTASLMGKSKGCLKEHLVQNLGKGVEEFQHLENSKQSWKNYQEAPFKDSKFHESCIHHIDGGCDGLIEDPGFDLNVFSEDQQQSNCKLPTNTCQSKSSVTPMHYVQNVFESDFASPPDYNPENECEQAVNFSQTLVDFSDNGMLFSSISKSLGKVGSSSSFHQNFNALPTMVTFDVVDFENEGECEQQIDLSQDEEAISPFETFDHSYVQESMAECDEHFLQIGSNQSFHNYNWGVTSLPRHLDQYKLNPLRPVPLSLNRRSKSLDTEILELEIGGLQMSKGGLKSYDLLTPWEDKNSLQCESSCLGGHKADFNSCDRLGQIVLKDEKFRTRMPFPSSKQVFSKECPVSNSRSQLPVDCRHDSSSITELVQYNTRQSQEDISYREKTTKRLACVLPLEEQMIKSYNCSYNASKKQLKARPIGITQAMPQQCKKDVDSPANLIDQSGPVKKGILEQGGTSATDWSNYNECSNR
ncbi:APC membrane recruitment protein 1 [Gastrophryne carolinensis]